MNEQWHSVDLWPMPLSREWLREALFKLVDAVRDAPFHIRTFEQFDAETGERVFTIRAEVRN